MSSLTIKQIDWQFDREIDIGCFAGSGFSCHFRIPLSRMVCAITSRLIGRR